MQGFKRFILRSILVAAVPAALLLGVYAWVDPFKVLRDYDTYYTYQELCPLPNLAMASVRQYQRQSRERRYNAFLFGSSIAQCLPADYWLRYLPADAEPYYLNSDQSSIASIRDRLEWLDARGDSIKYAIVMLTPATLIDHEPYEPAVIAYPEVSGNAGWLRWHWTFVKGFYHRDFLASYIGSALSGEPVKVRSVTAMVRNPYGYDPHTNYMPYTYDESILAKIDLSEFHHPGWPVDHPGEIFPPLLSQRYRHQLDGIADVLKRQGTDYRIIIPPNAHHSRFAPADVALLRATFGDRLIDVADPLNPYTRVDTLWYDPDHFCPTLGRLILDCAYR